MINLTTIYVGEYMLLLVSYLQHVNILFMILLNGFLKTSNDFFLQCSSSQ